MSVAIEAMFMTFVLYYRFLLFLYAFFVSWCCNMVTLFLLFNCLLLFCECSIYSRMWVSGGVLYWEILTACRWPDQPSCIHPPFALFRWTGWNLFMVLWSHLLFPWGADVCDPWFRSLSVFHYRQNLTQSATTRLCFLFVSIIISYFYLYILTSHSLFAFV